METNCGQQRDDALAKLRRQVCAANRRLGSSGLVELTWGNVSGYNPDFGVVAIKPSGVAYEALTPDSMVLVDLAGNVLDGSLRPSSDTPTHLVLYRAFPALRGIVHTHSVEATAWAQAAREIPCLGTTHADVFHGPVPVARFLTPGETDSAYEENTGNVIVERFATLDPLSVPGILAAGHGPFTWGTSPEAAVDTAISLEAVAKMARLSLELAPLTDELPSHIAEKHFLRKHGAGAYYGQQKQDIHLA